MQVRLQTARKVAELARQKKEALETKKQDVSALLRYDHRAVTSRAEAIGLWLGNCFCFSLLTQGPYCAGILLHVRHRSQHQLCALPRTESSARMRGKQYIAWLATAHPAPYMQLQHIVS